MPIVSEELKTAGFRPAEDLSPEVITKVKGKLNIPEEDTISHFFDNSVLKKAREGFAITDKGVYWKMAGSKADGKQKDKGSLTLEDLKGFTFRIEVKMLGVSIFLTNTDMQNSGIGEYEISFTADDNETFVESMEPVMNQLAGGSSTAVSTTDSDETAQSDTIDPEKTYELDKFKAYIDPYDTDNDAVLYYRRKFSKYQTNGVERFNINWSWSGFLFSVIYLVHRKAYKEAAIAFVAICLMSLIPGIGTLICLGAMGVISPYILYRRFKSVEKQIESTIEDREKKLETYRQLGGTNVITQHTMAIAGAFIFLSIVGGFIVGMVQGCMG